MENRPLLFVKLAFATAARGYDCRHKQHAQGRDRATGRLSFRPGAGHVVLFHHLINVWGAKIDPGRGLSACRTSANTKMEKTALAELLQTPKWRKGRLQNFCKRQNGEKGACRSSANVKMEKRALAELLQTSKWRKERLQNFCKRQNGEKGACGTSANTKTEKRALAELPQTSKRRKRLLREFRKRQNGEKGPCGTSASVKTEKKALAELPQTSKRRKRPLREFRKRQNGEKGLCGSSASVKTLLDFDTAKGGRAAQNDGVRHVEGIGWQVGTFIVEAAEG